MVYPWVGGYGYACGSVPADPSFNPYPQARIYTLHGCGYGYGPYHPLASLIAQEMVNLTVWPHLRHYLEDTGKHLSKPWQASHWLCEIGASLVTPMICIQHQDYYVFEPAKLIDGSVVISEHWYTHKTGIAGDS
ncbi:hypothetical protein F5I97DRAFT_1928927 [Phlebopus sp. FC_14]|nr:hypothetical protein F5I97DRAFT_1928927 [Phlebopus sp. FC_14]